MKILDKIEYRFCDFTPDYVDGTNENFSEDKEYNIWIKCNRLTDTELFIVQQPTKIQEIQYIFRNETSAIYTGIDEHRYLLNPLTMKL